MDVNQKSMYKREWEEISDEVRNERECIRGKDSSLHNLMGQSSLSNSVTNVQPNTCSCVAITDSYKNNYTVKRLHSVVTEPLKIISLRTTVPLKKQLARSPST